MSAILLPAIAASSSLVGVIVGGLITTNSQRIQRRADQQTAALDRAVAAVAAIFEAGNEWSHRADLLMVPIGAASSAIEVVGTPEYERYRASEKALAHAIGVARIDVPDSQFERLEELRMAYFRAMGAAVDASRRGSDAEPLRQYGEAIVEARALLSTYVGEATDDLRARRRVLPTGFSALVRSPRTR